jgi:hypothetical protein
MLSLMRRISKAQETASIQPELERAMTGKKERKVIKRGNQ